jgi:hypothetical protein
MSRAHAFDSHQLINHLFFSFYVFVFRNKICWLSLLVLLVVAQNVLDIFTVTGAFMLLIPILLRFFAMNYGRESRKLTEVTASDKLEGFRASKEVMLTSYGNLYVVLMRQLKYQLRRITWNQNLWHTLT